MIHRTITLRSGPARIGHYGVIRAFPLSWGSSFSLLESARRARSDADIACVLAKQMFENWIASGASTPAGLNGLPDPLPLPDNPEDLNGAAWLDKHLRDPKGTRRYKKTVDAEVFVRQMNLADCQARSPSFDKLCRELASRLPAPEAGPPTATAAG